MALANNPHSNFLFGTIIDIYELYRELKNLTSGEVGCNIYSFICLYLVEL